MPKPVPPPPEQPTEEETRQAVKLVRYLGIFCLALFVGLSSCYHSNATMVSYGRSDAISWNVYRAQNIDQDNLRSHSGEKIAWLVGSSILRESFDAAMINERLAENNSEWRVRKFGMTRGAAGVSSALLRLLPINPGDIVVHSVAMGNFRKDWLGFNNVPTYRLMLLLNQQDFWSIGEWSLPDKLEQASALPTNFYAFHESYTTGLTEWSYILMDGLPKKKNPGFHSRFHTFEHQPKGKTGSENPNYFPSDHIDFSPLQFNVQGLSRMRRITEDKGATLVLIDIPPKAQYTAEMIDPTAQAAWESWRTEKQIELWPQIPESDYYDLKHPNFRGRQTLSNYLVGWLLHRS